MHTYRSSTIKTVSNVSITSCMPIIQGYTNIKNLKSLLISNEAIEFIYMLELF